MTCADHQRTINRFSDHEIKATECAELFEHLGTCTDCRRFYDSIITLGAELDKIQPAGEELTSVSFNAGAAGIRSSSTLMDRKASSVRQFGIRERIRVLALVLITVLVTGLIWTKTLPKQREENVDLTREALQSEMTIHQR